MPNSQVRSYDLSIISDQEAADRLGLLAAEREQHLDEPLHSWDAYENTRFKVGMALDVLALRKAQVRLSEPKCYAHASGVCIARSQE